MSSPNTLSVPQKSDMQNLGEWFRDSDRAGGFFFFCFVFALVLVAVVSMLFGLYYFVCPPVPKPVPRTLWISVADLQDKLTPRQREIYVEYACETYEKELALWRLEQEQKDSGIMFPKPARSCRWKRDKNLSMCDWNAWFRPKRKISQEKIHKCGAEQCYEATDDDTDQVEKEVNQLFEPEKYCYV